MKQCTRSRWFAHVHFVLCFNKYLTFEFQTKKKTIGSYCSHVKCYIVYAFLVIPNVQCKIVFLFDWILYFLHFFSYSFNVNTCMFNCLRIRIELRTFPFGWCAAEDIKNTRIACEDDDDDDYEETKKKQPSAFDMQQSSQEQLLNVPALLWLCCIRLISVCRVRSYFLSGLNFLNGWTIHFIRIWIS